VRTPTVVLAVTLAACTGEITGVGSSPDTATGEHSVERGALWVAAKVPYCQAPNHQHDGDTACASTCERPANPDWDPYRSDCSGFVSWAWELPPPGRTTRNFAPFQTDLTHTIDALDLRAGDAVNNSDHIMLFKTWTDPGHEATFLEETGCSSSQPYAIEVTAPVTVAGTMITVMYRGTYSAIRYDDAP
jgi:hypothetical protein